MLRSGLYGQAQLWMLLTRNDAAQLQLECAYMERACKSQTQSPLHCCNEPAKAPAQHMPLHAAHLGLASMHLSHGLSRCMVHSLLASSRVKHSLSCSRLGRACQNSIRSGVTLKPPQNSGFGICCDSSAYLLCNSCSFCSSSCRHTPCLTGARWIAQQQKVLARICPASSSHGTSCGHIVLDESTQRHISSSSIWVSSHRLETQPTPARDAAPPCLPTTMAPISRTREMQRAAAWPTPLAAGAGAPAAPR